MVETQSAAMKYTTVAASQTGFALGSQKVSNAMISHIIVTPTSTSPGVVTLLDGATSIPLFVGGASSLTNLQPFVIRLCMRGVGKFTLTTGTALSCVVVGDL